MRGKDENIGREEMRVEHRTRGEVKTGEHERREKGNTSEEWREVKRGEQERRTEDDWR